MTSTKHDCFVGNLSYNTTEENLREVFIRVGEVIGIRICTDRETGRPKGYAFIEYADAATALSAIRNLDGADFNGRKLRVSYSNNSGLKDVAREMGHVVQDSYQSGSVTHAPKTTADIVGALNLDEAHDILAAMKHIVEEDGGARAKMILDAHPQLVAALIQIQCRLGMSVPPELLAPPPPPPPGAGGNSEQQQLLLQQVMNLSEQELDLLPAEDREQMLLLRQQLMSGA